METPPVVNARLKLLCAALLSTSLAACGGGGSGGNPSTPPAGSSSSSSSSSSGGSSSSSGGSSSSSSSSSSGGTSSSSGGIQNNAPVISRLAIAPIQAYTNTTLTADLVAEDADGDPLENSFSWVVNGEEIAGETRYYLPSGYFSRGDKVQLTVSVSDGTQSVSRSADTTIQNSPPRIHELTFSPLEVFTNTDISATVGSLDVDSDPLITNYYWSVNGEEIADMNSDTLSSEYFVKGDLIAVTAEVSDGELQTTSVSSITVSDSPGTLSMSGVPETVQYGVPVSFTLSAVDPDGDDIEFKFNARPNGMAVDENGTVTWTPTGPMFDNYMDVYWEADLVQTVPGTPIGSNIRVQDESRKPPLARSGISLPNEYRSTVASGDFDGDGAEEILVTDYNQRLYTIGFDGSGYTQEWMYPYSLTGTEGQIRSVAAGDIDGDGIDEMLVGISNNDYYSYSEDARTQILIIDGPTGRLRDFIEVTGASISSIKIADVDNDNEPEIVYLVNAERYSSGEQKLEVRDTGDTHDLLWQSISLAQQSDLAVGDIDGDGIQEIVLSGGYTFGHNGTTFVNEWLSGDGFGYIIRVADIDGDDVSEIIGRQSSGDRYLNIYDAVNKSTKAQIQEYFADFTVKDVDGDGSAEILTLPYYSPYEARLYSFDEDLSPQFSLDWSLALPDNGSKGVIADVDGDEQLEYVALFDYRDRILVAGENPDIEIEWQSNGVYDISGNFEGGELANFNGKGKKITFFTNAYSYSPTYTSGTRAIQFDPVNGKLDWSAPLTSYSSNFSGTLTDLGQDGTIELLYISNQTPSVYSFFSDSVIWTAPQMSDYAVAAAKGRMNGDLEDDLIVLSSGGDITAYDPKNQVLLWGIDRDSGNSLTIADLDADDKDQVITSDYNSVTVYQPGDGVATLQFSQSLENMALSISSPEKSSQLANSDIQTVVTGDLDNDGKREVIVASYYSDKSWVVVLDHNLTFRSAFELQGRIRNLLVQEYGSGNRNILLSINEDRYNNSRSQFVEVDPITGGVVSRSPFMLYTHSQNSMYWVETNGDDIPELSYGTAHSMNITR